MLLFPDVTIRWDCHIYHYCHLLFFVLHHYVRLVSQQLFGSLESEVPQDFSSVDLNQPRWYVSSGLGHLESILGADVPVHYPHHLVMLLSVRCPRLHLTPCYYLLVCLRGIFAQPASWVLSAVVDPSLFGSCAAMISASVLSVRRISWNQPHLFVSCTCHAGASPSMMVPLRCPPPHHHWVSAW